MVVKHVRVARCLLGLQCKELAPLTSLRISPFRNPYSAVDWAGPYYFQFSVCEALASECPFTLLDEQTTSACGEPETAAVCEFFSDDEERHFSETGQAMCSASGLSVPTFSLLSAWSKSFLSNLLVVPDL